MKTAAAAGDCPACKAGLANTSLAGLQGAKITIRQISLEKSDGNATLSGAETHRAGNVTISVRKEDWDESGLKVPASLQNHAVHASGTAATDLMFANGALGATEAATQVLHNSSYDERLLDFTNDPEVKNFTRTVNGWGFTTLEDSRVERYEFGYKIPNSSAEAANLTSEPVVADIARYTFSNASAYRYKFMAIQAYSANGTQIPPKEVIPAGLYPPAAKERDFWGECWWTILVLILAVLALIVAILVAVAIRIAELYDAAKYIFSSFSKTAKGSFSQPEEIADGILKMPESVEGIPEDFAVEAPGRMSDVADEFSELGLKFPSESEYKEDILYAYDNEYWTSDSHGPAFGPDGQTSEYRDWGQENYDALQGVMQARAWNPPNVNVLPQPASVVMTAQILAGIALALNIIGWVALIFEYICGFVGGLMIKTAMIAVILAVVLILFCAGWVTSENEKIRMQETLNPEYWIALSEQNNGGTVYVPGGRPNTFVLVLNATSDDGMPYSWHVTSGPAVSFRIYHPEYLT
jgi:hypothetical protein